MKPNTIAALLSAALFALAGHAAAEVREHTIKFATSSMPTIHKVWPWSSLPTSWRPRAAARSKSKPTLVAPWAVM